MTHNPDMSEKKIINDGGSAFPTTPQMMGYAIDTPGQGTGCGPGMTLRDWFAGMAIGAIVERHEAIWESQDRIAGADNPRDTSAGWADSGRWCDVAMAAYAISDAMIERSNQ